MKFVILSTVITAGVLATVSLVTVGLFLNQYEILKPAYNFIHSSVGSSVVEEVLKYSIVLVLISLIRIKSGFIPFVGVGFGFAEAVIYLLEKGQTSIKPFWAHIVLGLVMASFFYLASKAVRPMVKFLYYVLALVFPVALHLFFNLVVIK